VGKKILINFGKRVKELRMLQKISQEELAFRSGLHRTYISSVERGERNISLINIERLAQALMVDPGALLGGTSEPAGRWL
jgi:transcriptional regulator with XRE-family HTH domain